MHSGACLYAQDAQEGIDRRRNGNGSIDTTEEAIVYVKDLDMFVTDQHIEDTPAVLHLGNTDKKRGIHTTGGTVNHHSIIRYKTAKQCAGFLRMTRFICHVGSTLDYRSISEGCLVVGGLGVR